jgi:regulator of nonsense transcripts 3
MDGECRESRLGCLQGGKDIQRVSHNGWIVKTRTDYASPSKPSRPARAYLRVKEQSHLDLLSTKVKQTTFQDAKNTTKDPCLLGPPSLEFAPFGKVPGSRVRHDGRQGTIDQDPEFIDFLQSLTEPVAKPAGSSEDSELKHGKVTTTPLVQFIKEKKANKVKEALAAKSAKASAKADTKDTKPEKPAPKVSLVKATPSPEKARREKATHDAIKAVNKSVAAMSGKAAPVKGAGQPAPTKDAATPQLPAKRERERGNASIAAKILQRDLGLGPKERRISGPNKATASPTEPAKSNAPPIAKVNLPNTTAHETAAQPSANSTQSSNEPKIAPSAPPTGPRNTKPTVSTTQPAKPTPAQAQRPPKPNPQPSAGAKSAFLKHANPSQGVTEPLLEAAFSAFGTLTRCEIDKKKGFGYVDFADPEGLKKAMQASPIKIGNGQVVVLENKSKPATKAPMSQGPANISQNKAPQPQVQAQPSAQSQIAKVETASTQAPTPGPPSTASSAPAPTPTAPRGAPVNARGGRGGPMGPSRGGFGPPGRAGRGGFRGRGGFFPNQHRGGSAGPNNANSQPQANNTTASPGPTTKSTAKEGTETK